MESVTPSGRAVPARPADHISAGHPIVRPAVYGLLASASLLAFYLVTITLAEDWSHAQRQLAADRAFIMPIIAGFGLQAGLFVYLRALHARAHGAGMTASAGASTSAMLACCAHHLPELLPILGISGAAVFLNEYKVELLWLALGMNLAGVGYFLRLVVLQRRAMSVEPDACVPPPGDAVK